MKPNLSNQELDARRAAARRTALILGAVALLIFIGFFFTGAKIL